MRKSLYIVATVIAAIFVGVIIFGFPGNKQQSGEFEIEENRAPYSTELEFILENKMALLSELVHEPGVVEYISKVNSQYSEIEAEKLLLIDEYWSTVEDSDPLLQLYTNNKVAERLKQLQAREVGFSEIFVTDKYGFNVAQTNKTSDIYQADEEWWQKAFNNGEGKAYAGLIEFDESSLTTGISVYVPVKDPLTGDVIGIVKGVVSIEDIKSEL